MRGVSIYFKVNTEKLADFELGSFILGRGDLLKCNDRRISHNHAILNVSPSQVTIKSTHINPLFFKPAAGSNLTILKENEEVVIDDGDEIALLPDNFWYKIKFYNYEELKADIKTEPENSDYQNSEVQTKEDVSSLLNSNSDVPLNNNSSSKIMTVKRELEDEDDGNYKRQKTEVSETDNNIKKESISDSEPENIEGISLNIKKEETIELTNDNELMNDINLKNEDTVSDGKNSKQDPISNQPKPSTSEDTTDKNKRKQRRDRCWYGASCYRKNSEHKHKLSHPEDSDYESDENDERPLCPYGIKCYRRSSAHRSQYRHLKTQVNLKVKEPKKKIPKINSNNPESSEDDYDYEDPFINDDSSDNYEPSDDDSDDSDFNLDNVYDNNDEDTKRLIREAKKFTKNKKL